jgi:hypothetical protein
MLGEAYGRDDLGTITRLYRAANAHRHRLTMRYCSTVRRSAPQGPSLRPAESLATGSGELALGRVLNLDTHGGELIT